LFWSFFTKKTELTIVESKETFMIIFKENQKLDEMAVLVASSVRGDGIPFRITVQSPDHQPPHAHVRDLATGKKKLGKFLLPKTMPRSPEDIKDCGRGSGEGIPDEWRELVFQWGRSASKEFPPNKNWDVLNFLWGRNEV
jgi:hypothetical protein